MSRKADTLGNSRDNTFSSFSTADRRFHFKSRFNMLLLILLAGCLASCAAQSLDLGPVPAAVAVTAGSINSELVSTAQNALPGNTVAFFVAAVQSNLELNEELVSAALGEVKKLIQQIYPQPGLMLTLKSITLKETRTIKSV